MSRFTVAPGSEGVCADGEVVRKKFGPEVFVPGHHDDIDLLAADLDAQAGGLERDRARRGPLAICIAARNESASEANADYHGAFHKTRDYSNAVRGIERLDPVPSARHVRERSRRFGQPRRRFIRGSRSESRGKCQ